MPTLLHLDASPRGDRSISRQLTRDFAAAWKQTHPEGQIIYRDLGHDPVPLVTETFIAAVYTPPEARSPELRATVATSDQLISELKAATEYVFGVPMYNFSVPAGFKAYIDQIVIPGRTYRIDESGNARIHNHTVPPGRPPFSYVFQALRARLPSCSPSGTKKTNRD